MCADVYAVFPHAGRGGWSWYTGAAAWMYIFAVKYILGIKKEGDILIIEPCVPESWDGFEARYRFGKTEYLIRAKRGGKGKTEKIKLIDDGEKHEIFISF